jgi:twitching motility protein PilT
METIYRVLDFFPAELERQARSMLAGTLKGIISQRLVKTNDGRSRVPAIEVMVGTARIQDAIENPDDTGTIHDAIAEGAYYGMQSFDQSLLQLVLDGAITIEEAMFHASSKQNFALLLEANNVRIDKGLRRAAAGSQASAQDELGFDSLRRGPGAHPLPGPAPVPAAAQTPYEPAAPAAGGAEFLPAIGGQPAASHATFPGVAAAPQTYQGVAEPQQPRPQPGITPDLPGHSAA